MTTMGDAEPVLRFPGFPGKWHTKTLRDFGVTVVDGDRGKNYPNGNDFSPEGFCLFLNAKNVTSAGFSFRDLMFISQEKDRKLSKGKLKIGDVVLTTRGTVGNIALFDASVPFSHLRINSGMVLLRATDGEISPRFLYSAFFAPPLDREVKKTAFGSAQPQLTVKGIYALKFSAPRIPEQRKIAEFLTAVDELIQQLSKKKALLENYKKGVMQQIFTQALRFKDDHGNNFPDWEEKTLGAICAIVKGKQLNRADLEEGGRYPAINGGVSPSGYTDDFNNDPNTITISEGGNSCGFVNLLTTRFWAGGHCYTLQRISSRIVLGFLFQYLKGHESQIMALRVGSGLPNIQKAAISQFPVLVPNEDEQSKIADFLTALDRKIEFVVQQITHTQTFKKGLLQQMFV